LITPRQYVGAVGVVFDEAGQVLLVEHVFRPNGNWGLPGGWIKRGENPVQAVKREIQEELELTIEVKQLLLCEPQGVVPDDKAPPGLGLAFYCRLAAAQGQSGGLPNIRPSYEILSVEWVDPDHIGRKVTALERKAIDLGKKAFESDR
jgi:8-oxo-dGTP pyrophosphatase MutT (NUDIX family)